MKIGVLGAGRMTEGLAPLWLRAGHEVMIGGRTPAKARQLAERLGADAGTLREAAEFGDVVFMAVLLDGVQSTLLEAGAADGVLRGKVIVESTNAIERQHFAVTTAPGSSITEQIATATGASVAKAFNQVHYDVWRRRATYAAQPLVVPIAGDPEAKAVAEQLVRDAGATALDTGGLQHAHELEAMAAVIIRQLFAGANPLSAFQLMVGDAAETQPAERA